MDTIKHVSIPNPCSQTWKEMTPGTNGRYCGQCAKTVVDFTQMPTDDILRFIAGNQHVCGRFGQFQTAQLNDQINRDEKSSPIWRKALSAAALVGILSFLKADGQGSTHNIEHTQVLIKDTSDEMIGKIATVSAPDEKITGVVVGNDNKLPLPGAMVRIKGTNVGTMTDDDGRFTLKLPGSSQMLVVNYIGYQTQEIDLSNAAKTDIV